MNELFQTIRLGWRLLGDARVPGWLKVGVPLLVLLYFLFPLDFLPDFIPALGQLDDIGVVLLGINLIVRLAPQPVVDEHKQALGMSSVAGPGYRNEGRDYWQTPPYPGHGEPTRPISRTETQSIDGEYKVIPPDRQ